MSYKTKKIIKIVAAFLVGVLACGTLLHFTGTEIKNPFEKEDLKNVIEIDDNYIVSHNTAKGVEVEVNKDSGQITLTGTASSSHELKVTELTLKAGTYRITGLDECDVNEFYMYVSDGLNKVAYSGVEKNDANAVNDTFTLEEETTVSVWIYWAKDHYFGLIGTRITPVISEVK